MHKTFVLVTTVLWFVLASTAAAAASRRVLFVVGPSGHPPGTHEIAASARLLKYCVDQAGSRHGLEGEISEGWPTDPSKLEHVRVVVFVGDMFPPYRFRNSSEVFAQLNRFVAAGGSIVCLHYATSVNDLGSNKVPSEVQADLFRLLGGFGHFLPGNALPGTQARVLALRVSPAAKRHPVMRGVGEFALDDEPYYPIRFDAAQSGGPVAVLATAQIPPEAPRAEPVAWSLDRGRGSRSVAVLFPHYFQNWEVEPLRKLVLNAIFWTADVPVPRRGVESTLPALETFRPAAVRPAAR